MKSTTERLDALRGGQQPRPLSARTLVGMAANPGCTRRALLDACGADKREIAAHAGFPWPFGQSPFAMSRGNAFEALVKEHGAALLLAQLRQVLDLPIEEVAYIPLDVAARDTRQARYRETCNALKRAATGKPSPATLYDHPLLRLCVGGQYAYLEPDLVAFKVRDLFYVMEIKSFPVIDDQADGTQIAAATKQASTYVIALQDMFTDMRLDPGLISTSVFLVTPKGFGSTPVATLIDARKEITMLRRQLQRMDRIADLLDLVPPGVSFDLATVDEVATRPRGELAADLRQIPARYRPGCTAHCELAGLCRDEARTSGSLDVYGAEVTDVFGGVDNLHTALALAENRLAPGEDQADVARTLAHAERLRSQLSGQVA